MHPATVRVRGSPFGVVIVPGGRYAVDSVPGPQGRLAVLVLGGGGPRLLRVVTLQPASGAVLGMAISPDGKYLAVTETSQTALVSLPQHLHRGASLVRGVLSDRGFGAIEAAFSADGSHLFVTDENTETVNVFNVAKALHDGFSSPGVAVGRVPVGLAPVGMTLSPDGRLLYVTSEGPDVMGGLEPMPYGLLQVINVAKAETDPMAARVAKVRAGCQPVRVQLSDGGALAWVTARGSNALLAFDTARLATEPSHALQAVVGVGMAPEGVLITGNGRYALTADSARFTAPGEPQVVSVIDTAAALAGRKALIGTVPAGAFPREFAYDPVTHQAVLTNFGSATVETFPAAPGTR
jgi:DNA-binding beta-propeller fold protein YncE